MLPAVQAGGGGAASSTLSGHDSSSKQQHKSELEHPSNNVHSASGKTKKRDRSNHQSGDSSERSIKPDDVESKRTRRERNGTNTSNNGNKVEDVITSFLDKNGVLSNPAGVDPFYNHARHHDQIANRVTFRTRVAGVIAGTDRDDCLNRFTQLGGLGLLDDWLQEAHRGKDSAKESAEEGTEDLLLTLLRALEKLPVDLDSLKSCNAGKSVSNLKSHKSPEISKKAKKLVDLWKRKVDSELKPSGENTKNGSLNGICGPFKPMASNESTHGLKSSGGSVDGTTRSSARSAKATINNNSSSTTGEVLTKPIPASLGKVSPLFSTKENSAEVCNASIADERSTNNQRPSCNGVAYSNGQSKSTCTVTNTKSGVSSRPANGLLATGLNGTCKDIGPVKPPAWSWSAEISSNMSAESDKSQNESTKIDAASNQRLIVRLPNPGSCRSQPASCTEDALTSVTTKTGGTSGADQNKPINLPERGIEEIGRQCRAGREVDCQSSESQLSFNSSGQKSEQCNRQASDAENIGICLLACVAADESSRSGKDLPRKNNNLKEGESIERPKTSGECTKPHQNNITTQVHGDADVTDAQESVDCKKSVPVHSSEITVMGQTDENTRAIQGCSVEHPSHSKALKGASPWDDGSSGHSHTELLGSTLHKSHGEENAQEPSLEDKKQVLHHSRNAEDTLASMTGSGRYDDDWRDEKVYSNKSAIESKLRLPGEDALEVAVQVAKEVEQKYGKTALDKENPEASTSLENIVASKESQAAKEGKENIIVHSNDVEKCDLYMRCQLEWNSVNSLTCKTEGQAEKFDHKEKAPSTTSPSYKQNEHSSCSLQTFDGGPREGKKLKFAEEDLKHGSPRTSTPEQTAEVSSSGIATEAPERYAFDLNEGIMLDESSQEPNAVYPPFSPIPIIPVASHSVVSSSLSTPKAVVASSKGAFVPPGSPFKARGELGWRGSAATSAFRPAEPRKTPDRFQAATGIDGKLQDTKQDGCKPTTETDFAGCPGTKVARPCLDFDLNVADEGVQQEELATPVKITTLSSSPPTPSNGQSGVRLYLDLNQVDEGEETGPVYQTKPEVATVYGSSNGSSSGAKPIKHDFDLNDGLNMDDSVVATKDSITSRGNVRISSNQAPPFQGPKIGVETNNLSPWSHNGGPIPAMMPAFPSMRSETPFPVAISQTFFNVGQGQGIPSFHADMFRPPGGFSSSSTATFPYPAQPPVFPYASYSFGFNSAPFPAPSASFMDSSVSYPFPPAPTQILASGAIPPSPVRPSYMMGLTKVSTPSNNDRVWGSRPSLDLNAGPEPAEVDTREDRASVRQFAFFEGPLLIDEQTRVFRQPPVSADSLKRKEPEGGWDLYRPALKQDARR